MKRRVALILIGVALLVVGLVALRTPRLSHSDCMLPVRVMGLLVDSTDAKPLANAFVMTADSQPAAGALIAGSPYRERIDEWISQNDAREEAGRDPESVRYAPWVSGGAFTQQDGTFSVIQVLLWSYDRTLWSQSRPSRPPTRYGIEVLRIEIEGREPVILDAPHGTWTEHPEDDDLWATYDLGVVEVP